MQAREAKDSLEMGQQHLDFLPPATGLHVLRSCGVRTGHVAGVFVQIPRDLAGKSVPAALGRSRSASKAKSARENVPSVRLDLSKTGMCGL